MPWHSSHDRCLKPVPIGLKFPPARRTQDRLTSQGRFHLFRVPPFFSANESCQNYTAPLSHFSFLLLLLLLLLLASLHLFFCIPSGGGAIISRPSLFSPAWRPRTLIANGELRFTELPRCCRVFCLYYCQCLRLSHGILDT